MDNLIMFLAAFVGCITYDVIKALLIRRRNKRWMRQWKEQLESGDSPMIIPVNRAYDRPKEK